MSDPEVCTGTWTSIQEDASFDIESTSCPPAADVLDGSYVCQSCNDSIGRICDPLPALALSFIHPFRVPTSITV